MIKRSKNYLKGDQLPENNEEVDLSEIPPIGGLIVCIVLIVGLLSINFSTQTTVLTKWAFIIGSLAALLYIGFRFYQIKEDKGLQKAVNWLITPKRSKKKKSKKRKKGRKVPPVTKKKRNELYFERAEKECEWCGKELLHRKPNIHHIKPASEEGTSNKISNLIVLCRDCHDKADSGFISKDKLRYKVRKQNEKWEDSEKWL